MKGRPSKGRKTKVRSKAAKATRARSAKSKTSSKSRKTSKAPAKRKIARGATAARNKASNKSASRASGRASARKEVFGEGNYTASREFRRQQTGFVQRNKSRIPEMGEEAAQALEGAQRADLRKAEDLARSHSAGDED